MNKIVIIALALFASVSVMGQTQSRIQKIKNEEKFASMEKVYYLCNRKTEVTASIPRQ